MFNGVPALNLRGSTVAGAWGVVVVVVSGSGTEGVLVVTGW